MYLKEIKIDNMDAACDCRVHVTFPRKEMSDTQIEKALRPVAGIIEDLLSAACEVAHSGDCEIVATFRLLFLDVPDLTYLDVKAAFSAVFDGAMQLQ